MTDHHSHHCLCQQQRIDTASLLDAVSTLAQEMRYLSLENVDLRAANVELSRRVARLEQQAERQ